MDGSDGASDEESDLITLKGLGQETQWRFPNDLTRCPMYTCRKEFGIRDAAIDHFKYQHIKNAVYCEVCDKPVGAKCRYTFEAHYKNLHPNVDPPEFLKNPLPEDDKKVRKSIVCMFLNVRIDYFPNCLFHTTE